VAVIGAICPTLRVAGGGVLFGPVSVMLTNVGAAAGLIVTE